MILLLWACAADKDDRSFPHGDDSAETGAPSAWTLSEPTRVFTGGYADASVLHWNDRYWMYLNTVATEPGGTLLYTSDDAVSWTSETPVLLSGVATARATEADGGLRLTYPARGPAAEQNQPAEGEIALYSAWSADGVAFADEDGARLRSDSGEPGGPALLQLPDGTWRLWFDLSTPSQADPAVDSASIWGASSTDGLDWILDEAPTLEGEADIEGVDPVAQVLHPFVFADGAGVYWMLYNAHATLYLARSTDALRWDKQGALGLDGADATALAREDGTWTLWYGTYSEATGGDIWSSTLGFSP